MGFSGQIGGGATVYDVSPPPDTVDSKAAGASLDPKTFGAFTGANAGDITTYVLRTNNPVGSTAWTDGGTDDTLGPWTPSGDADGSNGGIALEAYIGSVLVATALHDYSRAAAGGGGGGSLISMIDLSGVNYNFLTTGGTGGTGGPGPHTVAGLTWTMTYTAGTPTRVEIVNGVLIHEGDINNRALLIVDQNQNLSKRPWVAYYSIENATHVANSPCGLYAGENTTINGGNQAQLLPGSGSATSFLQRENVGSSPSFTTVNNAAITDVSTTPTRGAMHIHAGTWTPSWDQGVATLPTDGSQLGNTGSIWMEGGSASGGQNRKYLYVNLIENCHVRVSSYILEIAP